MTQLWEAEHPYYCSESNYYSNEPYQRFPRWQDFIAAEGDTDLDLNLVFRWDLKPPLDEHEKEIVWQGDEYYRDCLLQLFYVGQRKGLFRCVEVDVCRADEPAIRAWLQPRKEHLLKLWEPL